MRFENEEAEEISEEKVNEIVGQTNSILPLYVLALFNKAMLAEMCEFQNDKCTCLQEKPKIGVAMFWYQFTGY